MIRYQLECETGHSFEGWFASSSAFDEQLTRRALQCPMCNTYDVQKAIMAPHVAKPSVPQPTAPRSAVPQQPPIPPEALQKLRELSRTIKQNGEYVGDRFASEARALYYHEKQGDKLIYGEATREEAKDLHEEGIPVAPMVPLPEDLN